jgi:hypothetical protein
LDCGISIETFWESSLSELADYMESYRRKMRATKREEVLSLFLLANLISERHPMVDKEKNIPSMPWDIYPELFEEDKEKYEREQREIEFEEYMSKRKQAMMAYNKTKGGGEEDERT